MLLLQRREQEQLLRRRDAVDAALGRGAHDRRRDRLRLRRLQQELLLLLLLGPLLCHFAAAGCR